MNNLVAFSHIYIRELKKLLKIHLFIKIQKSKGFFYKKVIEKAVLYQRNENYSLYFLRIKPNFDADFNRKYPLSILTILT